MDIEDEIGGGIGDNLNSDPLEGGIDGVDNLDTSLSSVDTEQGMPPTPLMGEDPGQAAPPMGEDPLAGDPNSLNAGEGNAPEGYDQLTNKGKAAVDAYTKSIADEENGGQDSNEMQPDMGGQMPPAPGAMPESRVNFKRIIDETFSAIFGDGNPSNFERGTTDRPQTVVGEDALTQLDNPYLPR